MHPRWPPLTCFVHSLHPPWELTPWRRQALRLWTLVPPPAHQRRVFLLPFQVNGLIKEREGYAPGTEFHRCKEMSEYCSTLCRHLYLFPGHPPA